MVDEFQDTNSVQLDWSSCCADPRHGRFMVGDEHQSIYRFRNADLEVFRGERQRGRSRRPTATSCRCSATSARGPRCSPPSTTVGRDAARRVRRAHRRPRGRRRAGLGRAAADARRGHAAATRAMGAGGDRPRAAAGGLAAEGDRRGPLPRPAPARAGRRGRGRARARSSSCCARSPTSTPTRRRSTRAGLRPFVVGGRGYWTQQQVEDLIRLLGVVSNPLDDEYLFGALASFANGGQPRRALAPAPRRDLARPAYAAATSGR